MNTCFVIMPFGQTFDDIYNVIYKPVIKECGLFCVRADEVYGSRPIITDIVDLISKSSILVANLTGKNPNVNYELGLAHGMGKAVVLSAENIEDIPFDYRHLRIVLYNSKEVNWVQDYSQRLLQTIREINENPEKHRPWNNPYEQYAKKVNDFLIRSWRQFQGSIYYEYDYNLNNKGDCWLKETWEVIPEQEMTHIYTTLYCDKPGKIEITGLKNMTTGSNLDYVIVEKTESLIAVLILLDSPKKPKSQFFISFSAYAENYMADLFSKKEGSVSHTNNYNSKLKQYDRKIKYTFNLKNAFNSISGKLYVINDDRETEIKKLKVTKDNSNFTFSADFSKSDNLIPEFKMYFKLK